MFGIISIVLPDAVRRILSRLRSRGYLAYIIGGCVRDALLGKTPGDYDIASSALPDEVEALFSDHALVTQGKKHGTVGVVEGGAVYEITTFRVDGAYTDGRHPDSVTFSGSLLEDVKRRDFTVNAMAYDEESGVIDLVGGLADLGARRIRCVGEPEVRFREDGLRLLRALRFSSTLDFDIEEGTAACVLSMRRGLGDIARERILIEFKKLLVGRRSPDVLARFRPVVEVFLAALSVPDEAAYLQALNALSGLPEDAVLRLAALLIPLPKDAVRPALDGLMLSRRDADRAFALVRAFSDRAQGEIDEKRQLCALGAEAYFDALRIRRAYGEDTEGAFLRARGWIGRGDCLTLRQLALKGGDVLALGVPAGEAVGRMLRALLDEVMAGRLPNERAALCDAIRNML